MNDEEIKAFGEEIAAKMAWGNKFPAAEITKYLKLRESEVTCKLQPKHGKKPQKT